MYQNTRFAETKNQTNKLTGKIERKYRKKGKGKEREGARGTKFRKFVWGYPADPVVSPRARESTPLRLFFI